MFLKRRRDEWSNLLPKILASEEKATIRKDSVYVQDTVSTLTRRIHRPSLVSLTVAATVREVQLQSCVIAKLRTFADTITDTGVLL